MIKFFRKYHKWIGLFFSFFILMFAFSGIVLNHRKALSPFDIPREMLPKSYRYSDWNNGAITGTIRLSPNEVLMYGNSGIWLADSLMQNVRSCTDGLPKGIDNRTFRAVSKSEEGTIFAVSTHRLYMLEQASMKWTDVSDRVPHKGDVYNDIFVEGSKLYVVMRSHIYESQYPYEYFKQIELLEPQGYSDKVSLFRTMWVLHSGELFGLPGKLVVDFLGLIIIVLTITGLILTFAKKPMRRHKGLKRTWLSSLKWHNKLGSTLLLLLLLIGITGWFLRPPMLISIVRSSTKPVPLSTLDSKNPWHQKIRNLRYDPQIGKWLLYSSSGFYQFPNFGTTPEKVKNTPPVSVMGINVWERNSDSTYLVGSFSGLYEWNTASGAICNAITKVPYQPKRGGMRPPGVLEAPTSGYSADFTLGEIAFDYSNGAYAIHDKEVPLPPMPEEIRRGGRMSLWHFALELHVGRLYSGFLLGLSPFFVFFSGLLYLFIITSGYLVYRKRHRKRTRKVQH